MPVPFACFVALSGGPLLGARSFALFSADEARVAGVFALPVNVSSGWRALRAFLLRGGFASGPGIVAALYSKILNNRSIVRHFSVEYIFI